MHQPINGCHGHHVVVEDTVPLAKGLVGGNDQTAGFIAMRDQFKQDIRFLFVFFNVTNIIENQHAVSVQPRQHFR